MGRDIKSFRNTRKSINASKAAQSYAKINRFGSFGSRIINLVKVRGKANG